MFQMLMSWARFARTWAQQAELPRHLLWAFFVTPSLLLLLVGTVGPEILAGSWLRNVADTEYHWEHRTAGMGQAKQDVIAYRKCVQPPPKPVDTTAVPKPEAPRCDDYAQFEEPWPAMAEQAGATLRASIWTWYGVSALLYPVLLFAWRVTEAHFRATFRLVWSGITPLFQALYREWSAVRRKP